MSTVVQNEQELARFAQGFAHIINRGAVVALSGELGAGKTTFSKYLVAALGSKDRVQSPTFTLLREYKTTNDVIIQHFDLYRISSINDLKSISFTELISDPKVISIIEWPEVVRQFLPSHTIFLEFRSIGETSRVINLSRR